MAVSAMPISPEWLIKAVVERRILARRWDVPEKSIRLTKSRNLLSSREHIRNLVAAALDSEKDAADD